jgi:hypothetical protein
MLRRATGVIAALCSLTIVGTGAAQAAPPAHVGPFTESYSFIGMSCDGFDILIEGTLTARFTVYFDSEGEVDRVVEHVAAPHDVLTNTVTGESIVVRAHFTHLDERVAGTDTFTRAITGFRYLVTRPGEGIVLRDVGRIEYATPEQVEVTFSAGVHDLAYDVDIEPAFCALLS